MDEFEYLNIQTFSILTILTLTRYQFLKPPYWIPNQPFSKLATKKSENFFITLKLNTQRTKE